MWSARGIEENIFLSTLFLEHLQYLRKTFLGSSLYMQTAYSLGSLFGLQKSGMLNVINVAATRLPVSPIVGLSLGEMYENDISLLITKYIVKIEKELILNCWIRELST
jgi:hypothetical protein